MTSAAALPIRDRPDNILRRLWRDCRGNAFIEFSLVGVLYMVVAFTIIDVGLELLTQEMLDNAVRDAARQIRIGASGYTTACAGTGCTGPTMTTVSSNVKTRICNNVPLIPNCTTNLQLYIAAAPSGQATGAPPGCGFVASTAPTSSSCAYTSTASSRVVRPATITNGSFNSSTATALISNYDVILEAGYNRPWYFLFANFVGVSNTMVLSLLAFQTEPY
jgi:Flp pilus assembly protein TadG